MIRRIHVEKIVAELRQAIKYPKMYLGVEDDPLITRTYLNGVLQTSAIFFGVDSWYLISKKHEAIATRGYQVSAKGPECEMEEKGLSKTEIVVELIQIHIVLFESLLTDSN